MSTPYFVQATKQSCAVQRQCRAALCCAVFVGTSPLTAAPTEQCYYLLTAASGARPCTLDQCLRDTSACILSIFFLVAEKAACVPHQHSNPFAARPRRHPAPTIPSTCARHRICPLRVRDASFHCLAQHPDPQQRPLSAASCLLSNLCPALFATHAPSTATSPSRHVLPVQLHRWPSHGHPLPPPSTSAQQRERRPATQG